MGKPNCYECEYRGTLPGSAHSCCEHPAFAKALSSPLGQILGIFASVGRIDPFQVQAEGITVKGDPHGIRKGWFCHPYNFDPTWLIECTGFKKKG